MFIMTLDKNLLVIHIYIALKYMLIQVINFHWA